MFLGGSWGGARAFVGGCGVWQGRKASGGGPEGGSNLSRCKRLRFLGRVLGGGFVGSGRSLGCDVGVLGAWVSGVGWVEAGRGLGARPSVSRRRGHLRRGEGQGAIARAVVSENQPPRGPQPHPPAPPHPTSPPPNPSQPHRLLAHLSRAPPPTPKPPQYPPIPPHRATQLHPPFVRHPQTPNPNVGGPPHPKTHPKPQRSPPPPRAPA